MRARIAPVLTMLLAVGCGSGRVEQCVDGSTAAIGLRVLERESFGFSSWYIIEARSPASNEWRTVARFHTEDRYKIPTDAVTVANGQLAYVVLYPIFAVTSDGGKTWDTWDSCRDGPSRGFSNQWYMTRAELRPDGSGSLYFNAIDPPWDRVTRLATSDFGKSRR